MVSNSAYFYFILTAIVLIFIIKYHKYIFFIFERYFINKNDKYKYVLLGEIKDQNIINRLWDIYDSSFIMVNKNTPCQQSVKDAEEFTKLMGNKKIIKYVSYSSEEIIGVALVSKSVKFCSWLSESYYDSRYKAYIDSDNFFYFLGIAVSEKFRRKGVALFLLKYVLSNIPAESILGFDHSYRVNKFLPYFIKLLKDRNLKILHKTIDRQVYHVINIMHK